MKRNIKLLLITIFMLSACDINNQNSDIYSSSDSLPIETTSTIKSETPSENTSILNDSSSDVIEEDTSSFEVIEDSSSDVIEEDSSSFEVIEDSSSDVIEEDSSGSEIIEDSSSEVIEEDSSSSDVIEDSSSEESTENDKKELLIYSIEMKGTYGDANLIKYNDFEILVDGGTTKDATYVANALDEYVTDDYLDMLVISHPDADHIDGLEYISTFNSINDIGMIVQNGDTRGSQDFNNNIVPKFPNAVNKTIVEIMKDSSLKTIRIDDDCSINFLDQSNYYSSSASKNNKSIAFTINFKNTILFMGGDMEVSACESIMKNYPNLTTEENFVVYKALHHGSKGTNKDNFLQYLKPDLCFVNAGMQFSTNNTPNFSSHPYLEAMSRIGNITNRVYWSCINGNLSIFCDGYDANVLGKGRSRDYYYTSSKQQGYIMANREEEKNVTLFESKYYQMAIEKHGYKDFAGIFSK